MRSEDLLAAGFEHAPYDGDSYRYDFGGEGDGAIYVEDLGNDKFSVSVYRPAGNQLMFTSNLPFSVAGGTALVWRLAHSDTGPE